jgi:hypothetical protein
LEFVGSFFQIFITTIGYALVFVGVYKIFQIGSDIREIKDAVKNAQQTQSYFGTTSSTNPMPPAIATDDAEFLSANSYAESLLKAVQAQESGDRPAGQGAPRS